MKVAFLGNMNNIHFAMARYLRDRGVDAHVLLYDCEFDHFHPSADSYDLTYREYCHQLSWGSESQFLSTPVEQVRRDLEPYDILIGCGLAPAYCQRAGLHLDIFVPYGDDIWSQTRFRLTSPHRIRAAVASVINQRKGIRACDIFHLCPTNHLYEGQYERYRGGSQRWTEGLPMVYAPAYTTLPLERMAAKSHWAEEFFRVREESTLMVMSHARHAWGRGANDPSAKGTERLLRGWAEFRRKNPSVKATLVTLEYGLDVDGSKKLIRDLQIEDSVVWLPKMTRKDLVIGLILSDIVCGEFENSWINSGVLFEALAVGKPVLAWRDDALYEHSVPRLYPILNAREPEEIATVLEASLDDAQGLRHLGRSGQAWYETEVVEKSVGRYLDHFVGV